MPGPQRPVAAGPARRNAMRPPLTRPNTARTNSNLSLQQARSQSGVISPALSQSSNTATSSQSRSPPKSGAGAKRKEREYEAEEETNIHVVVRCRGRSDREVRENSGVVVSTAGVKGQHVELSMGPSAVSNKTFHFDKVFSPAADQSMIYDEVVTPILDEMLAGYNCTIFAYGQTGTGKTYTMSGDMSDTLGLISDSAGIIPRVLNSLFRKLDTDEAESSVKCSFIELYNEELRDLLAPDDSTKLKIFDDAQKKGHAATMVQGMEESHVKTAAEGIKLLQNGSHKRQVAATKCNDLSSRSHTVFTITAYIKRVTDAGEDFVSAGKLNLVDLAGSENIQRSGAENKRAAEAGLINKSLLTLGRVINALVERSSHIPYRESKLTRLLQDSLGGRTKTCIIATLSPAKSNLEETISTLDYAFRAKNIKNKPQINSLISKKTLLKEFTAEIEKLKSELLATRQRNGVYMTAEGYDEIMEQTESRRILCDEQREKIETMEVSLRNKAQELFTLTNTFTSLKRDLEGAKQSLDETKGVLAKTDFILEDTKKTLAEEALLRKAHQATEAQLQMVGQDLINILEKSILDVEELHSNVKRKTDLQDLNRQRWVDSQRQVSETTKLVQTRLTETHDYQAGLVSTFSQSVQTFVAGEVEKLVAAQKLVKGGVDSFETACDEVVQRSSDAKHDMNAVLEEIKSLREEVKQKVGEGLNGLSVAAGRISAEVVREMESFHSQLHASYSNLGKDLKLGFDSLTDHISESTSVVNELFEDISHAATLAANQERNFSMRLEKALKVERVQAKRDRQRLVAQITELVESNGDAQETRWQKKIRSMQQEMAVSLTNLNAANSKLNERGQNWNDSTKTAVEQLSSFRQETKSKMQRDWKNFSERNGSIQSTTESVHAETVKIVDAQMAGMAKQMQALDDFVHRARTENERHHEDHLASLDRLSANVHGSFDAIDAQSNAISDRVRCFGDTAEAHAKDSHSSLTGDIGYLQVSLSTLQADAANIIFEQYSPTGRTPERKIYEYTKSLPRTDDHAKLLGRSAPNSSPIRSPRKSPVKIFSPTKTLVYTDAQPSSIPQPISPFRELTSIAPAGLREISLNVPSGGSAALKGKKTSDSISFSASLGSATSKKLDLLDSAGMAPPPLKRQATMDGSHGRGLGKLQGGRVAAAAATGMRYEGRENQNLGASLGSGRRLRSSPPERDGGIDG